VKFVALKHPENISGLIVQRRGKPPGDQLNVVVLEGFNLGLELGNVFGPVIVGEMMQAELFQQGGAFLGPRFFASNGTMHQR